MPYMNRLVSFVALDLYSYWYHRSCHKYDVSWHTRHHDNGVSVEKACAVESTISALLICSGIKLYESLKPATFYRVCRGTCGVYWALVSSSHYLGHKLDYSKVFPINKIQMKHLFHHDNPTYNFSIILPFDIVFGTSDLCSTPSKLR